MTKLEQIIEWYPEEELLSADGFENAVIGVTTHKPTGSLLLVYSRTQCINILVERDKMTHEEAVEYFDFNVDGAYVGERTPLFVDDEMFEI